MGSKIALKNTQDQEFSITHNDNAGAISLYSDKIAQFSDIRGFKNYIINGGFDIWQRGNSFNISAGQSAYVADRFFVVNTTNQTVTIEYGTVNNVGIDGKNLNRLKLSFIVAPTTGTVQIAQKIETVSRLVGKFTSSVYIATNENMYVSQNITQNFGSGGSTSVITNGTGFNTTSYVKRHICTYDIPSTDSKTIGPSNNAQLTYSFPVRTTNGMTFTLCQLEEGSVATPFEQRPVALELSLCQRYHEVVTCYLRNDYRSDYPAVFGNLISFKQSKRISPTFIIVNSEYSGTSNGSITNPNNSLEAAFACVIGSATTGGILKQTFYALFSASAEL